MTIRANSAIYRMTRLEHYLLVVLQPHHNRPVPVARLVDDVIEQFAEYYDEKSVRLAIMRLERRQQIVRQTQLGSRAYVYQLVEHALN